MGNSVPKIGSGSQPGDRPPKKVEPSKYEQIRDALIADIEAGVLRPGDKIPSKKTLMDRYGVSDVTVRRATWILIDRGYLEVREGSGIYVLERTRGGDG